MKNRKINFSKLYLIKIKLPWNFAYLLHSEVYQAEKVSTQANIPLLGFETSNEVLSYLDAVIRSGTSVDEKSGTVFLMGNTAHNVLSYFSPFQLLIGECVSVTFVKTWTQTNIRIYSYQQIYAKKCPNIFV